MYPYGEFADGVLRDWGNCLWILNGWWSTNAGEAL
jgi:hypothetical protein